MSHRAYLEAFNIHWVLECMVRDLLLHHPTQPFAHMAKFLSSYTAAPAANGTRPPGPPPQTTQPPTHTQAAVALHPASNPRPGAPQQLQKWMAPLCRFVSRKRPRTENQFIAAVQRYVRQVKSTSHVPAGADGQDSKFSQGLGQPQLFQTRTGEAPALWPPEMGQRCPDVMAIVEGLKAMRGEGDAPLWSAEVLDDLKADAEDFCTRHGAGHSREDVLALYVYTYQMYEKELYVTLVEPGGDGEEVDEDDEEEVWRLLPEGGPPCVTETGIAGLTQSPDGQVLQYRAPRTDSATPLRQSVCWLPFATTVAKALALLQELPHPTRLEYCSSRPPALHPALEVFVAEARAVKHQHEQLPELSAALGALLSGVTAEAARHFSAWTPGAGLPPALTVSAVRADCGRAATAVPAAAPLFEWVSRVAAGPGAHKSDGTEKTGDGPCDAALTAALAAALDGAGPDFAKYIAPWDGDARCLPTMTAEEVIAECSFETLPPPAGSGGGGGTVVNLTAEPPRVWHRGAWTRLQRVGASCPAQIYALMNLAARTYVPGDAAADRRLEPWRPLLFKVDAAVRARAAKAATRTYRGIDCHFPVDIYTSGNLILWPACSSASRDQSVAVSFTASTRPSSVFILSGRRCADISGFSRFARELELLYPPNSTFRVENSMSAEQAAVVGQQHLQLFELRETERDENRAHLMRRLIAQAPHERVSMALWNILRGDAAVDLSMGAAERSGQTPARWSVRLLTKTDFMVDALVGHLQDLLAQVAERDVEEELQLEWVPCRADVAEALERAYNAPGRAPPRAHPLRELCQAVTDGSLVADFRRCGRHTFAYWWPTVQLDLRRAPPEPPRWVGDAGVAVVAQALEMGYRVSSLGLRHNNITDDGGRRLLHALTVNRDLCRIDVAGNPLDRVLREALAVRASLNNGHVNVAGCGTEAALQGLRGVPALGFTDAAQYTPAALHALVPQLTALSFDSGSLPPDVARSLAAVLRTNTALRTFHVARSRLPADTCRLLGAALEANTTLQRLTLIDCEIDAAGVAAMAAGLARNASLTELDLFSNPLGDAGAAALATALATNSGVVTLHVGDTQIGEAGAAALADMLRRNTVLTRLIAGNAAGSPRRNRWGVAGTRALIDALGHNTTLTNVVLCLLSLSGAQCAAMAALLANTRTLRDLYLGSCDLRDEGAEALGAALAGNASLEVLALDNNGISAAGAVGFARAMAGNRTLRRLLLEANGIQDADGMVAAAFEGYSALDVVLA